MNGAIFPKFFVLVDGIYPPYSRFVNGIQLPFLADVETRYTAWQESARKDIARAFGVLQCWFQVMACPLLLSHSLKKLSTVVSVCLTMHNTCISDRIVDGDVLYASYNPTKHSMDEQEPQDVLVAIEYENGEDNVMHAAVGLGNQGNSSIVENMLARQSHWREVNDRMEHTARRLHMVLRDLKGCVRQD